MSTALSRINADSLVEVPRQSEVYENDRSEPGSFLGACLSTSPSQGGAQRSEICVGTKGRLRFGNASLLYSLIRSQSDNSSDLGT